jgi:hypothetical protein
MRAQEEQAPAIVIRVLGGRTDAARPGAAGVSARFFPKSYATGENQSFRAAGLSLITAAIAVYLARAVHQLRAQGITVLNDLLAHVAPLGWEHIALTGDYVWSAAGPEAGFQPLCDVRAASCPRRLSVRF